MGSGDEGQPSRRRTHFWKPFNLWWRRELEAGGKRPVAEDINRWYNDNAATVWESDPPSLKETRVHAKCLRSVDDVRTYFRRYRAKRNSQGGSQDDTDDEDHAPEADHGFPKAAGRHTAPELHPTVRNQQQQPSKRPKKGCIGDEPPKETFRVVPCPVPPPAHARASAFASPPSLPSFGSLQFPLRELNPEWALRLQVSETPLQQYIAMPEARWHQQEPAWAPQQQQQQQQQPAGYYREISVQRPPLSAANSLKSRLSAHALGQTPAAANINAAALTFIRPPCASMPTPTVPSGGLPTANAPLSCRTRANRVFVASPVMWSAPHEPASSSRSPLTALHQTDQGKLAWINPPHLNRTPGCSWPVPPGLDTLGSSAVSGGSGTQPGDLNPFSFSPEQHTHDYRRDLIAGLLNQGRGGGDARYPGLLPSRQNLSCVTSGMQRPLPAAASQQAGALYTNSRPFAPNAQQHLPASLLLSGAQPDFGPLPWPPGTAALASCFDLGAGPQVQQTPAMTDAISSAPPAQRPKEPPQWPLLQQGQSPTVAAHSPMSQLFSGNGIQWLDQLLDGEVLDSPAFGRHF